MLAVIFLNLYSSILSDFKCFILILSLSVVFVKYEGFNGIILQEQSVLKDKTILEEDIHKEVDLEIAKLSYQVSNTPRISSQVYEEERTKPIITEFPSQPTPVVIPSTELPTNTAPSVETGTDSPDVSTISPTLSNTEEKKSSFKPTHFVSNKRPVHSRKRTKLALYRREITEDFSHLNIPFNTTEYPRGEKNTSPRTPFNDVYHFIKNPRHTAHPKEMRFTQKYRLEFYEGSQYVGESQFPGEVSNQTDFTIISQTT